MCVLYDMGNTWGTSLIRNTIGAEESVIVSEVASFQRLKCMQEWYLES